VPETASLAGQPPLSGTHLRPILPAIGRRQPHHSADRRTS